MPYTILVLQALLIQFVLGFIAAGVTTNMSLQVIYWRRSLQRFIWGLTGYALLAAIVWDLIQLIRD